MEYKKYKKYVILFLIAAIAYVTFRHFNLILKLHSVKDITIAQNPDKIVAVKNNDFMAMMVKEITR